MTCRIVRTYRNGNPSRTIETGLDMAGVREYFNKPQDAQTKWQKMCEWADEFKLESKK